jgi:hypothetical protein
LVSLSEGKGLNFGEPVDSASDFLKDRSRLAGTLAVTNGRPRRKVSSVGPETTPAGAQARLHGAADNL